METIVRVVGPLNIGHVGVGKVVTENEVRLSRDRCAPMISLIHFVSDREAIHRNIMYGWIQDSQFVNRVVRSTIHLPQFSTNEYCTAKDRWMTA